MTDASLAKGSRHAQKGESNEERGIPPGTGRLIATSMAYGIPLFLKMGAQYFRFKLKAKKGTNIFEKELMRQGIDKEVAIALADEYHKASHIFTNFNPLQMARGLGDNFNDEE